MNEIFITSDLHLMHSKPFLYEPRGFTSIEEMNEAIVERWNEVVKPNDIIYNLGDFAMNDVDAAISYIQRLNGHIIWIAGNHDSKAKIDKILGACWQQDLSYAGYADVLKVHKFIFYLSHYPTLTGNMDDTGLRHRVWNLHGHTHSKERWDIITMPFSYNVCLDAHSCYPVNIEEVIADIKNRYFEISHLGIERRPLYDFES